MAVEALVFVVEERRFAVRARNVIEVVRAATLSPLPRAPSAVEGLLNFRGRVVPVVDIRSLFGVRPRAMEHTDHLIVVQSREREVVLRVDRATELVHCESSELQAVETVAPRAELLESIARTDLGVIYLLDLPSVLSSDDVVLPSSALAEPSVEPPT
jgi:purine-binding chemotaxis protein CheW